MNFVNEFIDWNYTDLGIYSSDIIHYKFKHENSLTYVYLHYNADNSPDCILSILEKNNWQSAYLCAIISKANNLSIIIDNLRPLFNLDSRGIYKITINRKNFILRKVPIKNNYPVWDTKLNTINKHHELRQDINFQNQIRMLLLFYDFINLSNIIEGNIVINIVPNGYTGYMIIDEKIRHGNNGIKDTLFSRWFSEDILPDQVIKSTISTTSVDLYMLQQQCHNIIKEIDSTYIWLANSIVNRLFTHLSITREYIDINDY